MFVYMIWAYTTLWSSIIHLLLKSVPSLQTAVKTFIQCIHKSVVFIIFIENHELIKPSCYTVCGKCCYTVWEVFSIIYPYLVKLGLNEEYTIFIIFLKQN